MQKTYTFVVSSGVTSKSFLLIKTVPKGKLKDVSVTVPNNDVYSNSTYSLQVTYLLSYWFILLIFLFAKYADTCLFSHFPIFHIQKQHIIHAFCTMLFSFNNISQRSFYISYQRSSLFFFTAAEHSIVYHSLFNYYPTCGHLSVCNILQL